MRGVVVVVVVADGVLRGVVVVVVVVDGDETVAGANGVVADGVVEEVGGDDSLQL